MMHITEPLPTDKRARLVFGLDWRAYPVKGGGAERRRYADAFGATHYVEYKVGDELIGGFAMPETGDVKGARLYSGAARVAQHERIKSRVAALVLLQDGLRVHAVFVVRGAVRGDEVLSLEEAATRRLAIEQECLKANLDLTTFGSGARIGDIDEVFQASELLANRKVGRIAKLPVRIPTAIPLLVCAVGAIYGCIQLMDVLSPPPPPPRVRTFQEQYAAAVRSTFARAMPRASALAPALLEAVGRSQAVVAGWVFDSVDCPTSGFCTVRYRRQGGSFADFEREASPSMWPVSFARDGLTLAARGAAVPHVAAVSLKDAAQWPSEQALIDLLQSPPQRMSTRPFEIRAYGYSVKLDEAKPLLPLPVAGEVRGRVAHLIRQGDWTIEGFRWQAPLLAKLPPNLTLDSLKVELRVNDGTGASKSNEQGDTPNGVHFTAKGKYYVLD
ncbi:type 4b pilus protein PilO2 [Burkholderia vietnamiensis]|uniref:type 4b pilus protein PilO2 n=1 Tax=Burkholderia vietnamiensis TaxID=60552 RepID=UPI00075A5A20|nr:type 4b pilus protein PilO2 [Burkholderia vietnamiensis]KVR93234.1 hypothetical protein WK29_07275 [Burkholderia vietnamiensis]